MSSFVQMPIFAMAILTGVLVVRADATSIDPATWPELVERSDLTGIIECTVAGGIVAKYRVVEAWKGEIPDGEIALLEPPDFWGPVFPTALVGQRFLVTARKTRGPSSEYPGAFLTVSIPRPSRGLYDVSRSKRHDGVANAAPSVGATLV
ncbi:MAG: hypothetical protein IT364_13300, partial [Candidatus Hydrogenedentes bacterium]|nr:hypothetical protein [Candidatus Hydrogenedentota bacterium]